MKKVSLADYLAGHGTQERLADALGCNQSAVSQMQRSSRKIFVLIHDDGRLEAIEERQVPARPKSSIQAA